MEAIWSLLLIGVAGAALGWLVLRQSRRRNARQELREQVQTWEDEGGNIPDVPTVAPRPRTRNERG
jgi:hypothetical protein